jgi:hypothetical protein
MTRLLIAAPLVLLVAALGLVAVDDVRAHQGLTRETRTAADLDHQVGGLRAREAMLAARVASLQTDNGRLQGQASSPTLAMWNACAGPCTIGPGAVRVGSVPDTFQLLISFTADVPVHSYVFSFHQWTQFDDCGFAVRCVTGAYQAYDPSTSLDVTFTEAEGCSAYIWVMQAEQTGTIKPDVRVHYQPAAQPTGVCAGG